MFACDSIFQVTRKMSQSAVGSKREELGGPSVCAGPSVRPDELWPVLELLDAQVQPQTVSAHP